MNKCPECGGKLEKSGFCNQCCVSFDSGNDSNTDQKSQKSSTQNQHPEPSDNSTSSPKASKCPVCAGKLERDGYCKRCYTYFDGSQAASAALSDPNLHASAKEEKKSFKIRLVIAVVAFLMQIVATALCFALIDNTDDIMFASFFLLVGLLAIIPGLTLFLLPKHRLDSISDWFSGPKAILIFILFFFAGWIVIVKNPGRFFLRLYGAILLVLGVLFSLLPLIILL